jgi:recombination DNA repair RAD52 pathway protein
MSFNNGYIQPDDYDYSVYRWQPTETDANKTARLKTNDLYQNTFQDDQKYPDYRAEKELEIADDITQAQDKLGDDYEQAARQKMVHKYQTMQAEHQYNDRSITDRNSASLENKEDQQSDSPSLEFENPEVKTTTQETIQKDHAGIETLAIEQSSLDKGEDISHPDNEISNEIIFPTQTDSGKENGSSDEISYEQGYYR